ncbi:MAG TPA: hypothetical protein VNZ57_16000 [Longimicrobiales bacterium]|nr:hypothetical protein [Longimicrobiales bacterium]
MAGPDRLQLLLGQSALTGLDFVSVSGNQRELDVHFLRPPGTLDTPLVGDVTADQVVIRRKDVTDGPPHPVSGVSWVVVEGRDVLRVEVPFPGGFELYTLRIDDARIDPFFNDITFSFKASCPSDLDCRHRPGPCPTDPGVDVDINYLARDFWSYRRALLDFASLRYPDWKDRLAADAGVMVAETFAAVADEMAYYQDRVAREAHLETATQRRSVRRHARLIDYDVHDGSAATAWLEVTVDDGASGTLVAGTNVWAESDTGERIVFEVGRGLHEVAAGIGYDVDAARNRLEPHIWHSPPEHVPGAGRPTPGPGYTTCLEVGATELYLKGDLTALLPLDDTSSGAEPGRWVLLRTDPTDPSVPARRWPVRLIGIEALQDPLVNDPVHGHDVTRVRWEDAQALPFPLELAWLTVSGNLVPCTAGETFTTEFVIDAEPASLPVPEPAREGLSRAVEREGPNASVIHLHSLPGTDTGRLAFLGASPERARPEVLLQELRWDGGAWVVETEWTWRRSFVGTSSSLPQERHFALEDGTWRRVAGFRRIGEEFVHADYATGEGKTIRFGDGEFGLVPAAGTVFRATYRVGGGRRGNVAADSIRHIETAAAPFVLSVTNPLPAMGGADPEPISDVKALAPEAFRAITFRAVRPEDYSEAAERLSWVQRAGTRFRWTGSWITAFTTPDPEGAVTLAPDRRLELERLIDRVRQAGREAHVLDPVFADLDLEITVCVAASSYRGEVKEAVLEALSARGGFFDPGNFTFGTPLRRSALEAAIQRVPGVRAVGEILVRRRGHFDWRSLDAQYLPVGDHEVIRVENDPSHPDRGSVKLVMEGGA